MPPPREDPRVEETTLEGVRKLVTDLDYEAENRSADTIGDLCNRASATLQWLLIHYLFDND